MEQLNANISSTLGAIMFGLQRAQNRRISYAEMAEEIGVSQRAFAEWMRGARAPAAMEALLRMLSMLPEDDVLRVLESWRNQEITQHVPNRPNSKSAPKKITRTTSKQ